MVELLESILSFACKNEYSFPAVEKSIARSSLFQLAEKRSGVLLPFIIKESVLNDIFGKCVCYSYDFPIYTECAWAAESYCHIQRETHLTFEAIFLYIPIKKMFEYFPIYHEMDFSHIIKQFYELFSKASVLSLLIDKRELSMTWLSKEIGMSYASIFSYKKRRRDIKKMYAEHACHLADIFDVRIETILELDI